MGKHRKRTDEETPTLRSAHVSKSSKWTAEQEIQLVKKRTNCLAHKWMHYRMARMTTVFASLLGFPMVVVAGLATAAQYYAQIGECDSGSGTSVTVGGIVAMCLSTLLTILTGLNAWLKPSETAELHRQASISYQSLVNRIEDEAACEEEDRELGRVFIKEIESQIELLEQNAPSVPWFIMKRYLTEMIGAFFLVLTIGLTVLSGSELAPLAIGSSLMVMVYMGGHISGGHYNPAVTLAVWMRGKLGAGDVAPYMATQIVGALLAAWAVLLMTGSTIAPAPAPDAGLVAVLLAEILFTFALCLVVLNVATDEATAGNSYYGLAIGFTVVVGAFAAGGISGGAFNPAVGIGPIVIDALLGGGSFGDIWIYVVGPLAGGALAALAYRVQHS